MTLAAAGLRKHYGPRWARGPAVLAGVDLDLRGGQAVLLTGANGSGKSTLLAVLAGLRRPTAGTVTVDGRPVTRAAARAQLAWCPERPALPGHHSARSALRWVARRRMASSDPWLAIMGLEHSADRALPNLSWGQQKRCALALAFSTHPAVLLLDEPLASLDADGRARTIAQVGAAKARGAIVVCASHLDAALGSVVDRRLHLEAGALTDR